MKNKKTFICPYCKKEQSGFIEARDVTIFYDRDFETGDYLGDDETDSDFKFFQCSDCGVQIEDEKLLKELNEKYDRKKTT